MYGLSLILLSLLVLRFQLILSSKSVCTLKLDNCSCLEVKHDEYKIFCSYEDHSSIEVKVKKPNVFITCTNNPSWSNFHYVWPIDRNIQEIDYKNCSAPTKSEDSFRVANSIKVQEIKNLRFYNLNGSLYSHNLEGYPNLTQLGIYNSDIQNDHHDFLKGNYHNLQYNKTLSNIKCLFINYRYYAIILSKCKKWIPKS